MKPRFSDLNFALRAFIIRSELNSWSRTSGNLMFHKSWTNFGRFLLLIAIHNEVAHCFDNLHSNFPGSVWQVLLAPPQLSIPIPSPLATWHAFRDCQPKFSILLRLMESYQRYPISRLVIERAGTGWVGMIWILAARSDGRKVQSLDPEKPGGILDGGNKFQEIRQIKQLCRYILYTSLMTRGK